VKITFEGHTFHDILAEMTSVVASIAAKNILASVSEKADTTALPADGLQTQPEGPGLNAMKPVDKPVEKPVDPRIAKMRAAKAAKAAARAAAPPLAEQLEEPSSFEETVVDPAKLVQIRQKTIEDLQSAYANGYQKEVFELLARFGNGAKSFRELPPDAFMPIREAIDNGALT
jgi:hypothetical protein